MLMCEDVLMKEVEAEQTKKRDCRAGMVSQDCLSTEVIAAAVTALQEQC